MIRTVLFLLMLPLATFGQSTQTQYGKSVTGVWKGIITQQEGGYSHKYGIELNLTQSGNVVVGTSKVWILEKPKVFAVMALSGEFENGRLTYRETAITHKEDLGTYYWCYKGSRLDIEVDVKEMRLNGPWWGTGPTPDCPPGMIYVKQDLPKKEEPPIVSDSPAEKNNDKSGEDQSTEVEVKNNDKPGEEVEEPEVKEEPTKGAVNGRNVVVQGSAVVKQKEMTLYVWDTDEIDGDRVTLYFNGEKVLEDHKITKEKYQVKVTLMPGQENLLTLYAENEGRTPPNTAAISWWEGGKFLTKQLHSDTKKCGTLSFKSN